MKKEALSNEISSFLGPGVRIEGTLIFSGAIRVDGVIEGHITSGDGLLVVGDKALIRGNIEVDRVRVMGDIEGNIHARRFIEIASQGRVRGDIHAPSVSIFSGARFDGTCVMNRHAGGTVLLPAPKEGLSDADR